MNKCAQWSCSCLPRRPRNRGRRARQPARLRSRLRAIDHHALLSLASVPAATAAQCAALRAAHASQPALSARSPRSPEGPEVSAPALRDSQPTRGAPARVGVAPQALPSHASGNAMPATAAPPTEGAKRRTRHPRKLPERATHFTQWASRFAVQSVLDSRGKFAGYCRAALASKSRPGPHAGAPVAAPRRWDRSIFPLPVAALSALPLTAACFGNRGRQTLARRHAVRGLVLRQGLALNFLAAGEPHRPEPDSGVPTAAQASAIRRLRDAASSMLDAARAVALPQLGLGRGKLAQEWEAMPDVTRAVASAAAAASRAVEDFSRDAAYTRSGEVLATLPPRDDGGAESIDVARVAFPAVQPSLDIVPLLHDSHLRETFLDPSLLESDECPLPAEVRLADRRGRGRSIPDYFDREAYFNDVDHRAAWTGVPPDNPHDAPEVPVHEHSYGALGDYTPNLVRACDKIPPSELRHFLEVLDDKGMLYACRDQGHPKCGFFGVRKAWDSEAQQWTLRLVLDRRPRNSLEWHVRASEQTLPHGSCFCDLVLDDGDELRISTSDLPSYYFCVQVSDKRAATNVFTHPLDERRFSSLAAVSALHEREATAGAEARPGVRKVVFCLKTLAMGDRNASEYAQAAHVAMLREHGAMPCEHLIAYRKPWPRSQVAQGVMLDDQVVVAAVPKGAAGTGAVAARARSLFGQALEAYEAHGIKDVPHKRRTWTAKPTTVWGCELQGAAGRVGTPRERRAGLSALTSNVAQLGACSVTTLRRLLGFWVDTLVYRRAGFCVLDAAYVFAQRYSDDEGAIIRILPGPVRSELLLLSCLSPLFDTNVRAPLAPTVLVTDASLAAMAAVEFDAPPHVIAELWRRRLVPGRYGPLDGVAHRKGDSYISEICESAPCRAVYWGRVNAHGRGARGRPTINVGEGRVRRRLIVKKAADARNHGTRQIVIRDSRAVIAAAAKGRATRGLRREVKLAAPHMLAADLDEGQHWGDTWRNNADAGTRDGGVPVPAPMRAWKAEFWEGSLAALDARLAHPPPEPWVPELTADVRKRDRLVEQFWEVASDAGCPHRSRPDSEPLHAWVRRHLPDEAAPALRQPAAPESRWIRQGSPQPGWARAEARARRIQREAAGRAPSMLGNAKRAHRAARSARRADNEPAPSRRKLRTEQARTQARRLQTKLDRLADGGVLPDTAVYARAARGLPVTYEDARKGGFSTRLAEARSFDADGKLKARYAGGVSWIASHYGV